MFDLATYSLRYKATPGCFSDHFVEEIGPSGESLGEEWHPISDAFVKPTFYVSELKCKNLIRKSEEPPKIKLDRALKIERVLTAKLHLAVPNQPRRDTPSFSFFGSNINIEDFELSILPGEADEKCYLNAHCQPPLNFMSIDMVLDQRRLDAIWATMTVGGDSCLEISFMDAPMIYVNSRTSSRFKVWANNPLEYIKVINLIDFPERWLRFGLTSVAQWSVTTTCTRR